MDTSETYFKMCEKAEKLQLLHREERHLSSEFIWLPRQDQLQEMIDTSWITAFEEFINWCCEVYIGEKIGYRDINGISSMEQLWLAFVMLKRFGKRWDGNDWQ